MDLELKKSENMGLRINFLKKILDSEYFFFKYEELKKYYLQ